MTFYETLPNPEPAPAGTEEKRGKAAEAGEAGGGKTPWAVQIAAIRSRATADKMAADLKKRGYRAYVTSGDTEPKGRSTGYGWEPIRPAGRPWPISNGSRPRITRTR